MCSRTSGSRVPTACRLAVLALLLAVYALPEAVAQPPATRPPDDAEVARALQQVKTDPNLATERTIKALRW